MRIACVFMLILYGVRMSSNFRHLSLFLSVSFARDVVSLLTTEAKTLHWREQRRVHKEPATKRQKSRLNSFELKRNDHWTKQIYYDTFDFTHYRQVNHFLFLRFFFVIYWNDQNRTLISPKSANKKQISDLIWLLLWLKRMKMVWNDANAKAIAFMVNSPDRRCCVHCTPWNCAECCPPNLNIMNLTRTKRNIANM